MCLTDNVQFSAVAVIMARGGSKRLPHKNVLHVGSCPMVCRAIRALRKAPWIGRIFVSTDDPETACLAEADGAEIHNRPPVLAGDSSRIDDAVADFLRSTFTFGFIPTWTLIVQPNVPLWPNDLLPRLEAAMASGAYTGIVTGHKSKEVAAWALRSEGKGAAELECVKRAAPCVAVNSQELPQFYRADGRIVAAKTWNVLTRKSDEYLAVCGESIGFLESPWPYCIDVDDADDLHVASAVVEELDNLVEVKP